MKKINIFVFALVTSGILFCATGCSSQEYTLNDKAKSETDYLSTKFISILNKLNNITFENYKVTTFKTEITKDEDKTRNK